jgi:hypothetical protein
LWKTSRLTDTVRHNAVKIAYIKEQMDEDAVTPASTKTAMMLVDCCTKPVYGVHLYTQISYMIGQRFYLTIDLQHYHDLTLTEYAWRHHVTCSNLPKQLT